MTATKEAVFTTDPRTRSSRCGMPYLQHRYTEVRLTSCTRRQASISVSRIESSSGGEMPALLKQTSRPPKRSTAVAYIACVGDVGAHVQPVDLLRQRRSAVLVQVGDHDVRSLGGEPPGARPADAA